ncbi:SAM-dependent methyltransferase [Actinoplanes sp. URMC 104]|uniref:SAM-dependent methyltransferase n=1 Tax=Actinoplanes sp. URMC 104 TaxID=3423409 RepID=UPI003F1B7425
MSDPLNADIAHPARRYNYWLGGKDNFAADRESADQIAAVKPSVRVSALENRNFMHRAARHLAGLGVRQFIDIGTGLPVEPNLHDVAQGVAADARVVYVDNDPLVMTHARALMVGTPEGRTDYAEADLRRPVELLAAEQVRDTLAWDEPIALMLIAILHFLSDDDHPKKVVATLVDALPAGSWIVASHGTAELEHNPEIAADFARRQGVWLRDRDAFAALFDHPRVQLVDPGLPMVSRWWREPDDPVPADDLVSVRGLVAKVS